MDELRTAFGEFKNAVINALEPILEQLRQFLEPFPRVGSWAYNVQAFWYDIRTGGPVLSINVDATVKESVDDGGIYGESFTILNIPGRPRGPRNDHYIPDDDGFFHRPGPSAPDDGDDWG